MPRDRDFGLDLLRASAILMVLGLHSTLLATHLPGAPAALLSRGWIGVDLFFVLSGFLIASQLFDDPKPSLRRFWTRRWTRTLPLYYSVLIAYALVKPLVFHKPFLGGGVSYLFFLQNFGKLSDFVQSWSLCIEEQFYFLFPIAALLLGSRLRALPWIWLIPWVASVAARTRFLDPAVPLPAGGGIALYDWVFKFPTLTHLDGISAGVFLAATRAIWGKWPARARAALGLGGAALVAAAGLMSVDPRTWEAILIFVALSAGFGAILVAAYRMPAPSGWAGAWVGAPVHMIALWSYGMYLWNDLLLRTITRAPDSAWLRLPLFAASVVGLASLTYYAVEKPGMRLRKALDAA